MERISKILQFPVIIEFANVSAPGLRAAKIRTEILPSPESASPQ